MAVITQVRILVTANFFFPISILFVCIVFYCYYSCVLNSPIVCTIVARKLGKDQRINLLQIHFNFGMFNCGALTSELPIFSLYQYVLVHVTHSHTQVNLCRGIPEDDVTDTCTASAGTLSVEFTILSRLLGDPVYEGVARRAVRALWDHRHKHTGLVGQFGWIKNT